MKIVTFMMWHLPFFPLGWSWRPTGTIFQPSIFTPLCLYFSQSLRLEHLPHSAPHFLPICSRSFRTLPQYRLYGEPSEAPPQPLSLV